MKFLVAVAAIAAVAHAATPVLPRSPQDSQVVRDTLQGVIDDTSALNTAVQGFQGVSQIGNVQSALQAVQDDLTAGSATFSALSPLESQEVLGLSDLVGPLTDGTDAAVQSTIDKKDLIVAACAGPIAYQAFVDLASAAQAFADALAPLAPAGPLQSIVTQASDQVQASIERGRAAYEDAQTLPDSCNGGTPTTTPGSEPTTTGGTAPTTTGGSGATTTAPGVYPTTTKVCPAGKHYRKRRAAREM